MIRSIIALENFESNVRMVEIKGDYEYSSDRFYSGTRSIKNKTIGNSATTAFEISINSKMDSLCSFMYMVSTEANRDFFNFYIDGVRMLQKSGTVAWTKFSTNLAAGSHKLVFQYVKDSSIIGGLDAFFIDDFIFPIFNIENPTLLFTDEQGYPYHNPTGEILKNLDFGTLIAGQVALPQKVTIFNYSGFPVINMQVYVREPEFPEKLAIEISKYNSPFIAEDKIIFNGIIEDGQSETFYVRAVTQEDTMAGGDFNIYAKADPL